jgi:hypothetical protein
VEFDGEKNSRNPTKCGKSHTAGLAVKSLKVPKIKKRLLREMKFLVPNYSCLQNT